MEVRGRRAEIRREADQICFAAWSRMRYFFAVSSVAEIIEAVKKLPEAEKGEFLQRLAEVDFDDAWDRQIDADLKAGRLDHLIAQAEADIAAGRTTPLDEVLGDG